MTISVLDPLCALILIDLQQGIVALPSAHPVDSVIARAATLAAAFRRHQLPVVLVNVDGGAPGRTEQAPRATALPPGWAELVPALQPAADDHRITKRTWGAFMNTGLDDYLKTRGVTQVVIAGIATSIGVESTARQAYERAYNVALACDAMTDFSLEAHDNSVRRIFPRLGECGTSAEIVALLGRRA